MTVETLLSLLDAHPQHALRIVLPDGHAVAPHFHVTEVGHVRKNYMDCGGTRRSEDSCVLQTWVFTDVDHRLTSDKLAQIVRLAGDVLPSFTLPVEIEHEAGVISQYPMQSGSSDGQTLTLYAGSKHTACQAMDLCCAPEVAPVTGLPVVQASTTGVTARCAPGSGCC
jgi:hypothetical protein